MTKTMRCFYLEIPIYVYRYVLEGVYEFLIGVIVAWSPGQIKSLM